MSATVMKCVTLNPSRGGISQLFCSIPTLLIDDSKSDEQCSSGRVAHTCLIFRRHQRKTAERTKGGPAAYAVETAFFRLSAGRRRFRSA